jgi:hypothetical protein
MPIWKIRTLPIAVLIALAAHPASPHMLPLTDRQLAAGSTDVVVAVVEEARSRWNAERSLIVTDYSLRVEDRIKGAASGRLTLTIPGGTVGNETHGTCVSTPLAKGARYLLFLDHPDRLSMAPVTGGWQGVFREIAGTEGKRWVGRGRGGAVVVSPVSGQPVELDGFLRSVRRLVAAVEANPGLAETGGQPASAWPTRGPLAAVDDESGSEPIVRNAAVPPIVFNSLLPGTPFEGVDEQEMAKWNRYAGDLFQVSPAPRPTWSFGNGVFDIAGFPDEAGLMRGMGRGWGSGLAFALVAWRIQDGHIVEADIAFNPAESWSLDDADTARQDGPLPLRDTLLAELGSAWGYQGLVDILHGVLGDFPVVSRDSVQNVRAQEHRLAVLFGEDAAAARSTYPGVAVRDGLISGYTVIPSPLTPLYFPARPSVASVRAGGRFVLGPVKIENPGSVTLVNPTVEVYLVPQRFSLAGAILLKRIRARLTLQPGDARNVELGPVVLPRKAPSGTYAFAFVLRDPADAYPENNQAWSGEGVQLTITR